MKTLLVQCVASGLSLQSFGDTAIRAVDFVNWWNGEKTHEVKLHLPQGEKDEWLSEDDWRFDGDWLTEAHLPIGSVEYVLSWLKLMGAKTPKPLNIPKELWKYVRRDIGIGTVAGPITEGWYAKSLSTFKDPRNGFVTAKDYFGKEEFQLTFPVEHIASEWRCFVLDGELLGIRCYSGDEWVLPDYSYIQEIIKNYEKRSYTLDVMVSTYSKHKLRQTDIIEIHDFFSCGLYGFEDYSKLIRMWTVTMKELLESRD